MTATQQFIATMIGFGMALVSPYVAMHLFRRNEEKRKNDAEHEQNVSLARLEEKIEGIPKALNGKILKAINRHRETCAVERAGTNPRIQAYDSEV